jgi:hypothetical protein
VINEPDPQADIPLGAHTQFWSNQLLADHLIDACVCSFDPVPADRLYETGIDAASSAG